MARVDLDSPLNDYLNGDERQSGGYVGTGNIPAPSGDAGGGNLSAPEQPLAIAPNFDNGTTDLRGAVSQVYQSALGRAPDEGGLNSWVTGRTPNDLAWITQQIYNSPEAQARGAQQTAIGNQQQASGGGGDPYSWIDETLRSVGSTDDPNYWRRVIGADPNGNGSARDYWIDRIRRGDGSQLVANGTLQKFQDSGGRAAPYAYANRPTYQGSNGIFDDPATKAWLDLLNQRISALNEPYHNPQLDQLNGYLQKYFDQLQGPTYTPQQRDLLQTQSLDPLASERDAARQRVVEQAARRGLSPQSGIVTKQLSDLDNQFEKLRTQTQAGFASKAIDLDRINQQQAAGVAQLLANIEQTSFNQNEQRANQALSYAQQVPDLARQRMMDANTVLGQSQLSPTALAQITSSANSADSAQSQQFWLSLAQLIPGLLNLFK